MNINVEVELMSCCKILFVEDDHHILDSFSIVLEKDGFEVFKSSSAEEAFPLIKSEVFDLILLDLNLPGMSGGEFASICKRNDDNSKTPIIIITGVDFEDTIVQALENYADDYITKPVRPRVLKARISAVLRRFGKITDQSEKGILSLNFQNYEVHLNGNLLKLTRSEFSILKFLYQNSNRPFSRDRIIKEIRGEDYHVVSRSLDFQIFGLRKKLGDYAHLIETVRGVGFRYKADT